MFILHTSNRTEHLLAHLAQVLASQPLRSPFASELFLIQSQGMERWLSQRLASDFGVFGNFDFLFPAAFFNRLAEQVDRQLYDESFDRERVLWRLEALLRNLDDASMVSLRRYLGGEVSALKRFQLAQQLAQLFDQYQMMRPDMLAAWQQGGSVTTSDSERWQMTLWRRLTAQLGDRHRGVLWLEAIERLCDDDDGRLRTVLPERVSVFGVNTMPPLFLDFLQALASHIQVHLYLLNPCQDYWADLESKRRVARRNLERLQQEGKPEPVVHADHPLLAGLGQQGREFQEMLLERVAFELELESFEPAPTRSTLQHLQNDILCNRVEPVTLPEDDSIQLHACHSRMREVEVLRDQLLDLLERHRDIELRDMVVMAPDIQLYAPFISAVFDDIPHAIADRSVRLGNPLADVLIRFLRTLESRFGWQGVLDLLEQPPVYPGFGLSASDLERVRWWIQETAIRWGRSADHRTRLGLPAFDENTWQAGLERLLMGYAMGDEEGFVDAVLPFAGVEGTSAQALGGLADFMRLLFDAAGELARPRPLAEWGGRLAEYVDRLIGSVPADDPDRLELEALLSGLADGHAGMDGAEVSLEVIVAWLESTCAETRSSSGFLRGQLTFCSMLPMRSIPFQVIALLGMNEGEFPKVDRPATFDLLAASYRKGDRSRRSDDRYQFLEIVLSARRTLIMTCIGRSIQNNTPIPPSVVVSELLDLLQRQYGRSSGLVVEHPLQPFSRRYFEGRGPLFSYASGQCQTAQALLETPRAPSPWWVGSIDAEPLETIDLSDLFAFFRHPQKYFVRQRLSLSLPTVEAEPDECEPFDVTGLDRYQLDQEWVARALARRPFTVRELQACGRWPLGTPGTLSFAEKSRDLEPFIAAIEATDPGDPLIDRSIDLEVGGRRLVGRLSDLYQHGALLYRYASLKGKDLVHARLHHLVANRVRPGNTWLLSKDKMLQFEPMPEVDDDLEQWVALYLDGRRQPSRFFVEPARAYVRQAVSSGGKKTPIDAARDALRQEFERGYTPELNLLYGHLEDIRDLLDETFETHCRRLLLPAWERAGG